MAAAPGRRRDLLKQICRWKPQPLLNLLAAVIALLFSGPVAHAALGDEPYITFAPAPNALALVHDGVAAPLVVDAQDWPGVTRTVRALQTDIERVSRQTPRIESAAPLRASHAVLIGTIGRSSLIDRLVRDGKIDVSAVLGRWESWLSEVVANPLPGIDRALVIAGSDKRGTIYGVYDVSEQIGVSPWHWWADVPVTPRSSLFVTAGRRVFGEPEVKYRGIFINDEAPALTGWVQEKFGAFDHRFYAHVFELLLRLRANYLWPAMWRPRAFSADDPENPRLADEMGIVIGTTHHEPMMRAHDEWSRFGGGAWNYARNAGRLREFWRGGVERARPYESIISLGMRGDGDEAMSEETNVALLERIVADQRAILAGVYDRPLAEIPQLWALYKEVQGYYERGMRVPDDVTLLWCDDNWGNIRRLPTPDERKWSGGAGVYYHFDYVGGPRNYKWLNTTPLTKIWEQMHLAWRHDANRIWIVNVGDLKPMEFPIEFFVRYAWDPARWPYEKLGEFSRLWATREFGAEHAVEIARLVNGYTKLNAWRKPELLAPDTFSLVNYREADRVLAAWRDLAERATRVETALPDEARAAFFQLVLHPIEACRIVNELYIAAGLNRLYAVQGRASTNELAARAREWFQADAKLTDRWDALLDGKWRHMMDQTHLGYTSWQQPVRNAMPAVTEIQIPRRGELALAVEGDPDARPGDYPISAVAKLPPLSPHGADVRWFEVFNRGQAPVRFTIETSEAWLKTSVRAGELGPDVRVEVSADWSAVPSDQHEAKILVRGSPNAAPLVIIAPIERDPVAVAAAGFVETDRHVAIEAPHFSRAIGDAEIEWRTLPDFGRAPGGVTPFPVMAAERKPGGDAPRLEYDVHVTSTGEVTVELQCAPSLDIQSGEGLRFAVSFDDAPPQVVKLDTAGTPQDWDRAVADGVRRVRTKHHLARPGRHVFKFWMITPCVVLERVILDFGGVRPSYFGPPESRRVQASKAAKREAP